MEKHSSLLQESVNYDRKKFCSTGPWLFHLIKLYYFFIIDCIICFQVQSDKDENR
jgi:hypothetical protein